MTTITCDRCNGQGTITAFAGAAAGAAQCPACRGAGQVERVDQEAAGRWDGYTTDRPEDLAGSESSLAK